MQAQADGLHGDVGGLQGLDRLLQPLAVLVGAPFTPLLQLANPRGQGVQARRRRGMVAAGQAARRGQVQRRLEALEQGLGGLQLSRGEVLLQFGEALRHILQALGRMLALFGEAGIEGLAGRVEVLAQVRGDLHGRQDGLGLLVETLGRLVVQGFGLAQGLLCRRQELADPLLALASCPQGLAAALGCADQGVVATPQGRLLGLREWFQGLPALGDLGAGGGDGGLVFQGRRLVEGVEQLTALRQLGGVRLLGGDLRGMCLAVGRIGVEQAAAQAGIALPSGGVGVGLHLGPLAVHMGEQGQVLGPGVETTQAFELLAEFVAQGAGAARQFLALVDRLELLTDQPIDVLVALADLAGDRLQDRAVFDHGRGHRPVGGEAIVYRAAGEHCLIGQATDGRLPHHRLAGGGRDVLQDARVLLIGKGPHAQFLGDGLLVEPAEQVAIVGQGESRGHRHRRLR